MAPHREFGIQINLVERGDRAKEPVGNRNAGILYGLGNLLENAVDYAKKEVTVTVTHTPAIVSVVIEGRRRRLCAGYSQPHRRALCDEAPEG